MTILLFFLSAVIPARPPVQGSHGPPNAAAPLQPSKHKRGVREERSAFAFSHLADAFIQSHLQMRTMETIKTNKI